MEIVPGVYETLISQAIEEKLNAFPENMYLVKKEDIDSADSYKMLAVYLEDIEVHRERMGYAERENDSGSTERRVEDAVFARYIQQGWLYSRTG